LGSCPEVKPASIFYIIKPWQKLRKRYRPEHVPDDSAFNVFEHFCFNLFLKLGEIHQILFHKVVIAYLLKTKRNRGQTLSKRTKIQIQCSCYISRWAECSTLDVCVFSPCITSITAKSPNFKCNFLASPLINIHTPCINRSILYNGKTHYTFIRESSHLKLLLDV